MSEETITTEPLIEKEMPSLNHSYVCARIMSQLFEQIEIQPLPELTLDIENGLTPDISVYRKDELTVDPLDDFAKFKQMPILAVEIISASQTIQAMREKSKVLKNAGIPAVWTVEPYLRSILVYDKNGERLFREEIVESENIRVDFSKVFA